MNVRRYTLHAALLVALVACGTAAGMSARSAATNGSIVFRRYFDDTQQWGALFSVNPDGTGLRQLTHPPKGIVDNEPVWSPDGKRIAYEHGRGNKTLVYIANANGSGARPLGGCTGSCAGQAAPAWSPDGSKLALGLGPRVGHESVWIASTTGTGLEQLTQRDRPATETAMNDIEPAWSPDGTKLVFVRYMAEPRPRGRLALFLINADGSGERQLTPWALRAGNHPDWSPDGKRILFLSNVFGPAGTVSNIYTVRADGAGLTRLTRAQPSEEYLSASFSPDGKWITFGMVRGSAKDARADVYVMRANGTGVRVVTKSALWDSAPDWRAGG